MMMTTKTRIGPSPRAWGLHLQRRACRRTTRTIPTRVGITFHVPYQHLLHPDHPHARGDYSIRSALFARSGGPSPRAWGLRGKKVPKSGIDRTIPTRVGITAGFGRRFSRAPDHPHARGDYTLASPFNKSGAGPSPRAWGLHSHIHVQYRKDRTIPTRVGITPLAGAEADAGADHPQARGDYAAPFVSMISGSGPSPRAWGLRRPVHRATGSCRTIPTRVGITGSVKEHPIIFSDHPHARGDYTIGDQLWVRECGPSPRAWGLRISRCNGDVITRTIPTRVGITAPGSPCSRQQSDHPHARGDYPDILCNGT